MENKWLFLSDILQFLALSGKKGFEAPAFLKATSFDSRSPHGIYLYGKIEIVLFELVSSSPVQN